MWFLKPCVGRGAVDFRKEFREECSVFDGAFIFGEVLVGKEGMWS